MIEDGDDLKALQDCLCFVRSNGFAVLSSSESEETIIRLGGFLLKGWWGGVGDSSA